MVTGLFMGEALRSERFRSGSWVAPVRPRLRSDLLSRSSGADGGNLHELQVPGSQSVCTLYDIELQVAKLMDGKRTLDQLVEAGRRLGLPMTQDQLEKFLRQLAAYQLIDNAEPLPPPSAAPVDGDADTGDTTTTRQDDPRSESRLQEPTAPFSRDVISAASGGWTAPERPKLRRDLETRRVEQGKSIFFELRNPKASATCTLYDIEQSVAQLMDGRRTLEGIMEESRKLGLPTTLDQLVKFIRQLAAYSLIENAAPLPPLFSSVKSEERMPRPTHEMDPEPDPALSQPRDNEDTVADFDREQMTSGDFELSGPKAPQEGQDEGWSPPGEVVSAFGSGGDPGDGPMGGLGAEPELPQEGGEPEAEPQTHAGQWPQEEDLGAAYPGRRKPLKLIIGGVVVVAVALGVLLGIRRPVTVNEECTLTPLERTAVKAPAGGTLSELSVTVGQSVKRGDLLAKVTQKEATQAPERVLNEVKRLEEELALSKLKPKDLAAMKKQLKARQKEIAVAKKAVAKVAALAKKKKASLKDVVAAKEKVKEAKARATELTKKLAMVKQAAKPAVRKKKQAQLDAARAAKAKAEAVASVVEVRAPIDGTVLPPAPDAKLKATVASGEELFILGDPTKLGAVIQLKGEPLPLGTPVRFTPAGKKTSIDATISGNTPPPLGTKGSEAQVTIVLQSPKGVSPGDKGAVEIVTGKRSLLSALLH